MRDRYRGCLLGGAAGDVPGALWEAYQRWLLTQHAGAPVPAGHPADGWLIRHEFLHHGRSPGTTCLSALAAGRPGTADAPVNDSKGCGGVMRVAPAGLAGLSGGDPFTLGGQAAALTHGHPSGYLAAAAFAQMISDLVHGRNVADAADAAIGRLQAQGEAEVSAALAVAVYCALSAADFRSGVLLAVNHGGDSDSTGAICGNLLGARLGAGAIDSGLLDGLEGRKVITQVADDLYDVFACGREPSSQRYPA